MGNIDKKLTIYDIAENLGVSASTVSRAISGKGRISEKTREKIIEYIQEQEYYPSAVAQGLANDKTYNIALVLPEVKALTEIPFFHTCMFSIAETAQINGYDLMVVNGNGTDTTNIERLINNRKVDGMILSRTYTDDVYSKLLKKHDIPFVTIGQMDGEDGVQIDNNHQDACEELTSILIAKGMDKIAYLGSGIDQMVNRIRFEGYQNAFKKSGRVYDESLVFRELNTSARVEQAVGIVLEKKIDCILCQDDALCLAVLRYFAEHGISVSEDIKLASCYDSEILENYRIGITALQFDIQKVGKIACQTLIKLMDGEEVPKKILLDYEVRLRESTK